MRARELTVLGDTARVHDSGGERPPIVLLHGAWAGAEAHWSPIWAQLAARWRVVAPELPIHRAGSPVASNVSAYADWVDAVFETLGIARAPVVGNSLGAYVLWRLAASRPERVAAAVLVDGGPAPQHGAVAGRLYRTALGRALLRRMLQYNAFGAGTLARAFADPALAPEAIVQTISAAAPLQLERMLDIVATGDPGSPPPAVPTLVVWGADDGLIGLDLAEARRLAAILPDGELHVIEGAGHCPQIEQPERFVEVLARFLTAAGRPDALTA